MSAREILLRRLSERTGFGPLVAARNVDAQKSNTVWMSSLDVGMGATGVGMSNNRGSSRSDTDMVLLIGSRGLSRVRTRKALLEKT